MATLRNSDAAFGGIEDIEVDMAGVDGQKRGGFLGPLDAGDGVRIVHKVLKSDIFQLFRRIKAITVKVIKRRFGLIDMHQNECGALHLLRMFEPEAFRKPFNESGLPAPELPFQTKDRSRFKFRSELLREFDGFLG